MRTESRKLLEDARAAAGKAARFAAAHTYDAYHADEQLQWALERGCEIVGDALAQLRRIDPAAAESITACRALVAFRDVLNQTYAAFDSRVTWDAVQTVFPVLRKELDALLADH